MVKACCFRFVDAVFTRTHVRTRVEEEVVVLVIH